MRHLLAILLILAATLSVLLGTVREGVAQTSESLQRTGSSEAGPPPGGCTPIGVTASGEIVFPLTCKDFIEQHKAADRRSSGADIKPTPAEISKAPEASMAPTTAEARRAPATAEASKPPADTEPTKPPTATDNSPADKEEKPAAAQALVDPAGRPAANQGAGAPDKTGNSEAEPATTAALPKRGKGRNRVAGTAATPGCTKFRSYDAATASYRDFNGQRRPCP